MNAHFNRLDDSEFEDQLHPNQSNPNRTKLEFDDIHFEIHNKKIIQGISGCCHSGEVYGIIGASGAGL